MLFEVTHLEVCIVLYTVSSHLLASKDTGKAVHLLLGQTAGFISSNGLVT